MHPYVNETCPENNLESGPSSNSVQEDYGNEIWALNNLVQPGSSSNSVPSLWTGYASQDRLLENQNQNQQSNFMMYPGFAVPGEYYSLIENQHFNSVQFNPEVNTNCNSNFVYPGFAVASKEFDPMDKVQVNSMYPDRGVHLFAFSPEGVLPDGQSFYDNWQVNSMYPGGVAVKSEMLSIHDLCCEELPDCNNQDYGELGGFPHYYQNDMWPSRACGGEGASSSVSVLSSGSAFSCQTVCSTPESEALLSPTAADHRKGKTWKWPPEHSSASPEVATNDYEVKKKKKKLRKWQCEVRISKKLPKSNDMPRQKLWRTFDEPEQARRATRVATYLLSGPKTTKYMDTPFDPEFKREIWELRNAVLVSGVTRAIFDHVNALVDRYGKHGAN